MKNEIGDDAGKVWQFLHQNGRVSFNKLTQGSKLKPKQADRAIGWLAREGKLKIEKEKNTELISLAE